MSDWIEIAPERARQIGLMMARFDDVEISPVSFNASEYTCNCFGFECFLLIKDNGGAWYKELRSKEK